TAGTTDIWSLACHENMSFVETTSNHELAIQAASFIRGDLTIGGREGNRITNANTLTVDGALNITGRYWLRGAGAILAKGGLAVDDLVRVYDGKDIYLVGSSDGTITNSMELNNATALRIQGGSTLTGQGNAVFAYGSNGLFEVDGTFERTSGNGSASIQSPIDNSGLIHNQTGEFILYNGGVHSGDILSDPGTVLGMRGNYDMQTASSLTAADLNLLSGTSTISGAVNVSGTLKVDGGGATTFTDEATIASYGQDLYVRQGTIHFESPAAAAVDFETVIVGEGFIYCGSPHFDTDETFVMNTLHLVCGNIDGADPITINNAFTWGGGGSFDAGGDVTCYGPVTIQATSSQRNLSRVFNNTAHATFLGQVAPSGAGRFNNLATGTVDLQGDSTGLTGGQSTNAGTITKTAGTGRSTLAGMTNSGQIHAQTGEIYFYFGGENHGSILGDPGTLLSFNGTFPFNSGSTLTGENVTFFGATATLEGGVDIAGTLTIDGGTCTFTSNANVTSYGRRVDALTGTFRFESPVPEPTLEFDAVQIGGGSYGASVHFDTGQPVHIGTLQIINGNIEGNDPITLTNSFTWGGVGSFFAGGKVTCNGASTVQYSSSQRNLSRDFDNAAYATVLGAIGLSNADYTNEPGGVLDFQSDNARFSLSSNSTLYNNGTMIKSAGSGISPIHVHFRNAGVLEIQSGEIQFYGSYGLTYIQTAGATILNGGGIDMITAAIYQIQGGDLTGNGVVGGNINNGGGSVVPGLSIGTLTCAGNYTHGAGAALEIELGGLDPGTEHDQFIVTGTANLQGGTLHVSPFGGFLPQVGQQFVVLTAANVQGTFDHVTGPGQYTVTYNPTNVTLMVDVPPCTALIQPDFDWDCDVDGDDVAAFAACALGPAILLSPGCEDKDLDGDTDADMDDFALLQRCYGGKDSMPPAGCIP
ncbi:MAG: hypothetical protein AMXMBFR13_03110, partial [Phycisphaerae bacterium]